MSQQTPAQTEIDAEVPTGGAPSRSDEKVEFTPNTPHPSLEFPPLYFGIKGSPQIKEGIKRFYSWRWSATYPLQKRIKGSRILRYFRIYLTYGEILMIVPLVVLAAICVYQTWFNPNVKGTGRAARLAVAAALLFAQKNSYLTMILGVPFDRALAYHKISGYIAVITGILHGVSFLLDKEDADFRRLQRGGRGGDGAANAVTPNALTDNNGSEITRYSFVEFFQGPMNTSGTMILLFIVGMFLTSIPYIRRKFFEVFYFIHLTLLLGIIGGTAVHTGIMVPLFVFLTTGVDFFVRGMLMARFRYPKKANLRIISESVVEVSFPKVAGFDYNPGQYIYISIPNISSFEWHPFSLSSAPHQNKVTLHIRDAGDWTFALYKLALEKSEVPIMIEGPYGNFGVDVMSEKRYKNVLLLSGGIGLTPMQSMFSHLVHEQQNGSRSMKQLKFVWIQRDPELMVKSAIADTSTTLHECKMARESFDIDEEDEEQAHISMSEVDDCESLASRILAAVPPSAETDAQLEASYDSEMDFVIDLPEHLRPSRHISSRHQRGETLTNDEGDELPSIAEDSWSEQDEDNHRSPSDNAHSNNEFRHIEDVLETEIYLTNKGLYGSRHKVPGVKMGRPDLAATFVKMRDDAIRLGERRVAVCVCGPRRIAYLARKACVKLSDQKVRFDYHEESFG